MARRAALIPPHKVGARAIARMSSDTVEAEWPAGADSEYAYLEMSASDNDLRLAEHRCDVRGPGMAR